MSISPQSRLKIQELAIRYGVPMFGVPYLFMVKRIREKSNNLTKDEEDILRRVCREMGSNYDDVFKKKGGKK